MKYLSIDVETSGLDRENHKVLSIGAICEDTTKKLPFSTIPKFHAAILQREITGSPFAINLNRELISYISAYQDARTEEKKKEIEKESGMKFYYEEEVVEAFFHFLIDCGIYEVDLAEKGQMVKVVDGKTYPALTSKMKPANINCAGKNFGTFDKLFLEKLPKWQLAIRIRQRIIDPSILYVKWKTDTEVPGLSKCKERAGLEKIVTHNALEDAWDVVQLLRKAAY
jgi:oligoribonuclease (3'-5' exoribonuclease)